MKKKIVVLLICSLTLTGSIYAYKNISVTANADVAINNDVDLSNSELQVVSTIPEGMDEKETILYKMINSMDFFDYAAGKFEYYTKNPSATLAVEYVVDKKNNRSYTYSKSVEYSSDLGVENIFKDGKNIDIRNNDKTYMMAGAAPEYKELTESDRKARPKDRIYFDAEGNKMYKNRQDPNYMGIASEVLHNENIAFAFLEDYSKWNINGEETYLDVNCFNITGEVPSNYINRLDGTKFRLLVDKTTGIILKLEVFDKSNTIGFSIISSEIQIANTGDTYVADNEKFEKDLTGYTEISAYKHIEP